MLNIKCYLCENFAIKEGFCLEHLRLWHKKRREFKKMFIQFMLEKQTMDARNDILEKLNL